MVNGSVVLEGEGAGLCRNIQVQSKRPIVSFSCFKTATGRGDLLAGVLAILGLARAFNLYTKRTAW